MIWPIVKGTLLAATMFMSPHVASAPVAPHAPPPAVHHSWHAHTGSLGYSEAEIWNDLRHAGLSPVQSAGVMANMDHESDFNVENHAWDNNNERSYGLFSWNAASYPDAIKLVTGHPGRDLKAQIRFMLHDTNDISQGLEGSSAYAVGGNWAAHVEICVGCQPGGRQFDQRSAESSAIYSQATAHG